MRLSTSGGPTSERDFNKSIVLRVRTIFVLEFDQHPFAVDLTFQVSQGSSVDTLFRWGGKRLQDFASSLFGKGVPNFVRIARVLWKILQKTFWSFFLDTL